MYVSERILSLITNVYMLQPHKHCISLWSQKSTFSTGLKNRNWHFPHILPIIGEWTLLQMVYFSYSVTYTTKTLKEITPESVGNLEIEWKSVRNLEIIKRKSQNHVISKKSLWFPRNRSDFEISYAKLVVSDPSTNTSSSQDAEHKLPDK